MQSFRVLSICLFLAACTGETGNALFTKPFDGNHYNWWPFDHAYPVNAFSEKCDMVAEDNALTWRGEELQLNWNTKCHDGHDWGVPQDTPLFAVAGGEVIFAGLDVPVSCRDKGEVRAKLVRIRHSLFSEGDYETVYVHLNRIDVVEGQMVGAGEQIGLSGDTGCTTGPHLHFGVYRLTGTNNGGRTAVDPFGWNGTGPDPWSSHPDGAQSIFLWESGKEPAGDYGEREFRG